ncbi:hypothetical protein GY14_28970 [Delftia tsuruhatensis]|nr:hypothetical protein GY14_28970 [Delftia tsuruhatensis]
MPGFDIERCQTAVSDRLGVCGKVAARWRDVTPRPRSLPSRTKDWTRATGSTARSICPPASSVSACGPDL